MITTKKREIVKELKLRLTAEEYRHLKEMSVVAGLKLEPTVRVLIMGLDVKPRPPDEFLELVRQVSGVATNINQIAKVANSQGFLRKEEFERLEGYLAEIRDKLMEF